MGHAPYVQTCESRVGSLRLRPIFMETKQEMRETKIRLFVALSFLGSMLLGSTALGQDVRTVKDGVYTESQAEAGEPVYNNSCRNCHNLRFYEDTFRAWNNQPLLYLWESVLATMPGDNPGSLMLEDYTNVIAYILSELDFPAGETVLDPDNGMEEINIIPVE